MKTVQILESDDKVFSKDWCRPLQITSMSGGHSDFYAFESPYTGQPENNAKWVHVDQIFGSIWFGKTVDEICTNGMCYEFIRGDIPKSHLYGKTNRDLREEYQDYLETTVMTFGKYKGLTLIEIKTYHYEYFEWAISKGIIDDCAKT